MSMTIEEVMKKVEEAGKFDWKQMQQILEGLKPGLDVTVYAKPEFNSRNP